VIGCVFGSLIFKFAGLDGATFPFFLLVCALEIVAGCSVISLVAALAPSIEVAMVLATFSNGLSMLFAGFFVTIQSIPVYYLWLYYSSYVQWALSAMVVNQFGRDSPFLDAIIFGDKPQPDKWHCLYFLVGILIAFRFATYVVLRIRTS
jgi:hypothetical protein